MKSIKEIIILRIISWLGIEREELLRNLVDLKSLIWLVSF